MDIEKLKRCLKCCADDNSKACYECELEYGEEECQDLCGYAATALTTFQAENKKLRADLEQKSKLITQQAKELERRDKLLKEQEDELERVKQKYNEAREAICTHCMDVPCREENCYWWRCPKKEG